MTTRTDKKDEMRMRLLRLLENDPSLSTRQLAVAVGASHGATYYCLKALIEKGFIKAQNFANSENKAGYAYVLSAKGIREKADLTRRFVEIKRAEYAALRDEIEAMEHELATGEMAGPARGK